MSKEVNLLLSHKHHQGENQKVMGKPGEYMNNRINIASKFLQAVFTFLI